MLKKMTLFYFFLIFFVGQNSSLQAWEIANKASLTGQDSKIIINIPSRELSLFQKGELIYRFPVAVGSPTYKTPIGSRAVEQIVWNPWWFPPDSAWAANDKDTPPGPNNPLGPVKMELGGTIRVHGTNKDQSVGHPVSHGCMRMHNEDAKTLAWWIQSHYSNKNDPGLLDDYRTQKSRSFYVSLTTPVPVEIRYDLFEIQKETLKINPDIYGKVRNRKEFALEWFQQNGISLDQINQTNLDHALESAKKQSAEIPLNKLLSDNKSLNKVVSAQWMPDVEK